MTVRARSGRILAAALLLAVGLLGATGSRADVRASTPDLTLVTAATYDVVPEERRVAVTVAITAANHLQDTATKRYYFEAGYLAVLPGSSHFAVSSPGLSPTVSVAASKPGYVLLKIGFGTRLASGHSMPLTLTFDVRDPGGAPDRPVRISPSLISFYLWAFASDSTPGSSVTLRMPAGYTVEIDRGPLVGPTTDASGRQVWTSGRLASPLDFIADVSADKPGGYVESTRDVSVGGASASIVLQAWPDDPEWATRVGDLFAKGLPVLGAEIGLPWPLTTPLQVQETIVRATGGYAGLFDPTTGHVQVAYAADPIVVLHEASHSWLNGALVADRWAAEAFASYYASTAAVALGLKGQSPELTPEIAKAAFPLNAWGPVDRADTATEAYGYAASLVLAKAIAGRAGEDGMRAVWLAASDRIGAYQPLGGPVEKVAGAPDWRALLDLFDGLGPASYEDLWRQWVVRPTDLPLLDERAKARSAYGALVAKADQWRLPASIRDAMRTWQFASAEREMTDASAVLDHRAGLEKAADAARLALPDTLRLTFEGTDGIAAAAAEANAEQSTLDALVAAAATQPSSPGPIETLGLVGEDPARDLVAARASFSQGDLPAAAAGAARAATIWRTAFDVGRGRVISIGLLVMAAALAVYLIRHRRSARGPRTAGWSAPGDASEAPRPPAE